MFSFLSMVSETNFEVWLKIGCWQRRVVFARVLVIRRGALLASDRQKGCDVFMRKVWVLPLLSALGLLLTLGGSAPASGSASSDVSVSSDPFPIQSGYNDCQPTIIISKTGGPPPALGVPALQPHLQGIPSFTADDVRAFLQVGGFPGADGPFKILKILFITSGEVCERLRGEGTGLEADALVCFVEVQGTFYPFSYPPGVHPKPSPYGYEVFDAQTGNLLVFGG
jgi:hypothetical protein